MLILTRGSVIEYLGEVMVAPVTTTVRDIPSEVLLSARDGLSRDCAVNCDHIQTVTKVKMGGLITTLSSERMSEIGQAVRFALNV